MGYTALYRKFRPNTFDDVKGQDHIVTTLKNQIQADRIGHAFLFCGTRGTGKTTCAKILAKAVNCPSCSDELKALFAEWLEVKEDGEGMQTMRILGKNMAWLIKCIKEGKNNGIAYPNIESHIKTNFIKAF